MNLRGGQSLWPMLAPARLVRGPLEGNLNCDVLVVGSGISGALVAFHLAELGADVVVIDRADIAAGSTPASTALLMYDLDVPLVELRRTQGVSTANEIYTCSRRALDDMAALIERLHLECGLSPHPSVVFQADALLFSTSRARRTFSIMSSAFAVHSKDCGFSLCDSM